MDQERSKHGGGTRKALPKKPYHKDYHHQSVAGSANTIATDNPDELAARAAESVKKYRGPDGNPLPGPVNVYGKIVGGGDKERYAIGTSETFGGREFEGLVQ